MKERVPLLMLLLLLVVVVDGGCDVVGVGLIMLMILSEFLLRSSSSILSSSRGERGLLLVVVCDDDACSMSRFEGIVVWCGWKAFCVVVLCSCEFRLLTKNGRKIPLICDGAKGSLNNSPSNPANS